MAANRFFKPFLGRHYHEGISGKKVLVIGNSFYCSHQQDCRYFKECTDITRKDSSRFDDICMALGYEKERLSNTPYVELSHWYRDNEAKGYMSYRNFGEFLSGYVEGTDSSSVWQYVAFTNYVQFFVPSAISGMEAISKRDFEAFKETVLEIEPDIVFVWGSIAGKAIRCGHEEVYDYDKPEFHEKDGYVCHMKLSGLDKDIVIMNTCHPCNMYGWWTSGLTALKKYADEEIRR